MKFKLFSIRDGLAACYLAPFVSRSDIDAKRQISASLNDPQIMNTPIGQNPKDFDLCEVGVFDDDTGEITPLKPVVISTILALFPRSTVSS